MAFEVHFTVGARNDLRALHGYIANNDSVENADYVAREIVRAALTLREFPQTRNVPNQNWAQKAGAAARYTGKFFFNPTGFFIESAATLFSLP